MHKLNKFSKIFLFLFAASGVIWLGSYITRLSLFYRLFQEDELILREFINYENLSAIMQVLITAISINMIFYLTMIFSFMVFILSSKLNLKQNGWLFISMVIVIITLPFEIYLMTIDYKILMQILSNVFSSDEILQLVIKRFTVLGSFPMIEILSYFSVLFLFMFQPLTKK